MANAALARGSFGDLVALLQTGLARSGHYTRTVDGDFGGGTDTAVRSLQADEGFTRDGRADADTWQAATGLPWPQLFDRCLQLTARIEGHGYRLIAGNFDGAGLTWGIIGFTLASGGIQSIVNEVAMRDASLLPLAFGANAPELQQQLAQPQAKLMKWADSISEGSYKQTVSEPWRTGFATLGAQPLVQEIQRRRARETYFDPATATAARLGLGNERDIALCFDIHVQNGGVKPASEAAFTSALAGRGAPRTAADKRALLARLVADSAAKKYRDDVFARKNMIATGQGVVHQQLFIMDNWGFAPD